MITACTQYWYAISYGFGSRMSGNGQYDGEIHAFSAEADRDAWVALRRTGIPTDNGYRESLSLTDPIARAQIRDDDQWGALVYHADGDMAGEVEQRGRQ